MKCPVCTTVNLVMTERQGVEIDYCPECRGVWLDRGELDKVIERSASRETVGTHSPQHHSHQHGHVPHQTHHGHGHKQYRRKSFLEELFD